MVLLERKKLSYNFPILPRIECLHISGFRSDEIKHLSSMVLTYYFCPEGVFNNTDYARAVKRCSSSVSVGLVVKSSVSGR
ncbi:CDG_1a_G0013690.mRNA.1.CDS.1 [Saccharomyces cerevisiae]|nr:CDG_1a_G0013690.mRNA.1.CDS.1 [Saccharomyces cerevisiae]CAI7231841.1 CDG_1a_G0013690.mRNA.1.CDS.1 [Saccharomyces cerevisiae]